MDARETNIFHAVLIAAIIIGGILLYMVAALIRLHRRQLRADRNHAGAELRLIEKERSRIAADLHDELGPVLSAAKFRICAVKDPGEKNEALLKNAIDHIDSMVLRIREIANDLIPAVLPERGIVFAIEQFIRTIPGKEGREIRLVAGELPEFQPASWVHVYRMMQEMIHNAVRHADASVIEVGLRTDEKVLRLWCNDDGKGFAKQAAATKGQGLRNILVRSEMLGGKMYIDSARRKGTRVSCVVPVNKN